ncbi:hypothetical protein Tco_0223931 [Tanacetum coccineum]
MGHGSDHGSGHSSGHGSAPVEDDSSVEEVEAPAKGKKVSKSSKDYTTKRNFQNVAMENSGRSHVVSSVKRGRTEDTILSSANGKIEFQRRNESGSCDLTVYQKACVEYAVEYDHDFSLESCTAQGGLNLNNDASGSDEEVREVRPMGRDQARKKKSSTSSRSEASFAAGGGIAKMVAAKWKSFKVVGWGKKKEQQQSYIDLKNRELKIQEKANRETANVRKKLPKEEERRREKEETERKNSFCITGIRLDLELSDTVEFPDSIDALVLLHDPVDGDEEGTGVQTDALIKEIQRSGAQTQFHPTRQSMNEVDLLDDGY